MLETIFEAVEPVIRVTAANQGIWEIKTLRRQMMGGSLRLRLGTDTGGFSGEREEDAW
jgi:hypothetical protein